MSSRSYYWHFLDFAMTGTTSASASMLLRRRRQQNSYPNTPSSSIPLLEYHPQHSLLQLIRERDWYGVRLRLHIQQQQNTSIGDDSCSKEPTDSTTPLHAACLYRAPSDVILRLIESDPSALNTTDAEGWIPLHVHLLYNTNNTDDTTLALIHSGGIEAANRHLRFGGAALHLACRHGASTGVLQALVDLAPHQIQTPTPSGSFAAHMILRQQRMKSRRNTVESGKDHHDEIMEKLLVLIRAWVKHNTDKKGSSNNTANLAVSDVIRFQVACSPAADVVGEYLARSYCKEQDDVDNTYALLTAASAPFTFCDPLPPVLRAFPQAASIRPYPLHVALRHPFRDVTLLLDAHPAALEERDAVSRLLPFQLAAAYSSYDSGADADGNTQPLERIYTFLRRAPHVILRDS